MLCMTQAGRRSAPTGSAAAPLLNKNATLSGERNVAAAFAVKPGCDVRGKRILVIDDVFTTRATVEECVRVLPRARARSVGAGTYGSRLAPLRLPLRCRRCRDGARPHSPEPPAVRRARRR